MPSLILIKSPTGQSGPQSFPLDFSERDKWVIGREKGKVDIWVDDGNQQVSRQHAVLTTRDGQFFVENVSRNGTLLNNHKIDKLGPQPLKPDDRVKICDFLFRFHDERAAALLPIPDAMRRALPDPDDAGEMTTVQHTTSRAAAQQFLDVQPTERLRALLEISTSLSRTLELDVLFGQIADALFSVFKQADRVFVIQLDDAGRPYPRVSKARRQGTDDRFSKTIIRRCIETGQAYLSEDASSDAALGAAQSIAEFRIRSVMCVPLMTADGKPLGALQLDTQDVGKKFKEDDLKLLTIVANLAGVAVEKAQVVAALVLREKAQREIELAKEVQIGFLPKTPPAVPGYEFFNFYSAAQTVGGDYYDYIQLPGGRVAVVLGDVAGKGVPAAMLMAKLSAEARFCFLTEPNPARAVALLNDQLVRGGIGDRFVTLAAMVIDPAAHTITVVNAGHLVPLRFCPAGCELTASVSDTLTGLPLGIMDGFSYDMEVIPVTAGDVLVVFSDGVTDARNTADELFDMAGVRGAVLDDPLVRAEPRPKMVGERLASAVRRHSSNAPQADDIALVCFGRLADGMSSYPAATATSTRLSPLGDGPAVRV